MQDHGPVGGNVKDYAADGVLRKDTGYDGPPKFSIMIHHEAEIRTMTTHELNLRIRETPCGKGVFSMQRFRRKQSIGRMDGTVVVDDNYDPDYCVDIGDVGVLVPGAPFRFLNHSCEPNCELVEWQTEDDQAKPEVWVHATRTIQIGDQLTINYAWPEEFAFACLCGSPSCQG
jgi:hypothetical protein